MEAVFLFLLFFLKKKRKHPAVVFTEANFPVGSVKFVK